MTYTYVPGMSLLAESYLMSLVRFLCIFIYLFTVPSTSAIWIQNNASNLPLKLTDCYYLLGTPLQWQNNRIKSIEWKENVRYEMETMLGFLQSFN